MHSIPESPSPERNIPQLKQTSPSHSSTELQSQQTNYENSDKISKDDSAPGSECNDECLGFKKSYSTQLQTKDDKERDNTQLNQNDNTSTASLYKKYKSDQIHFINNNNNRKMSSPICSYYSEYHKYLAEMIDKNVVDYSKSNNYIDKESIMQNQKKLSFCENNNNTSININSNNNTSNNKNTPTTPNVSSSYVYGYMPDSFIPVFSYNNMHQKTNTANVYKNGSTLNETKTENENKNDKTNTNNNNNSNNTNNTNNNSNNNSSTKNPETIGSKTPSIPTTQPPMNNKFGFPFSLGTHTPKLQYHNNFALNAQFMPIPIFIHKGINPMTPIYGQPTSETKPFPHFQLNTPNPNIIERKKHKQFTERPGDWVCAKCKNLNFAFRLTCNRCHLQKAESEKIGEAANTNKTIPQPTSSNSNEDNSNTENSSTTNSNDTTNVDNNTLTISSIETNGIQNYNSNYEVSSVQ